MPVEDVPASKCNFPSCTHDSYGKGLCNAHYQQQRRGEELRPLRPRRRKNEEPKPCTVPECGRPQYGKGFCAAHHLQHHTGREIRPLRSEPSRVFQDGSSWLVEVYGRDRRGRIGTVVAHAQISAEDREVAGQYRWNLANGYARATHQGPTLHNLICPTGAGEEVDHINGIRLDCRRENLRAVTHALNAQNRGVRRTNSTGVRGITLDKKSGKYRTVVRVNGCYYGAGLHSSLEDAERAVSDLRLQLMTHTNEDRRRQVTHT